MWRNFDILIRLLFQKNVATEAIQVWLVYLASISYKKVFSILVPFQGQTPHHFTHHRLPII
jgi:hypothetical protein